MQGTMEITVAGMHGVDGTSVVGMQGTIEITVARMHGADENSFCI